MGTLQKFATKKKFAWSWSRLKNWRVCPKRHYHVDLAKDFVEVEGEQLKWGNQLHEAMARYIERGVPLPKTMERYEAAAKQIVQHKDAGADVRVELKLAMDDQYRPTQWFDGATWFRGVVDVMYLAPHTRTAAALDWKTGKIEPSYEQLALNAALIFAHYGDDVDTVITQYQWLAYDDDTTETIDRDKVAKTLASLMPEVKQMEEAARTVTYPPKPNRLCKSYCPVTSCPHHGVPFKE